MTSASILSMPIASHPQAAAPPPAASHPDTAPQPMSLALQGGGAFGAFTWGVIDRLLEEPAVGFDAVSGSSAGAVNAVLLADGLRTGGREGAREKLAAFWSHLAATAATSFAPKGARAGLAYDLSSRVLSPYQLNPFDLNPLRALLDRHVDFAGLRTGSPLRLLVAATRVGDGSTRIFREDEVTLEAILASACLPLLHQAVEIEGERYWDGGYGANPPLLPLVEASEAARILLVQIIPTSGDSRPVTSPGIVKRLNQITFNNILHHDLEALDAMKRVAGGSETLEARKLAALVVDQVSAEEWFPDLDSRSIGDLDRRFVLGLRDSGRRAATAWLGRDESEA